MAFLKYWYFSLFFIASTVYGDNNSTDVERRFLGPNVKTQYHIASSTCEKFFCEIGSATESKSRFNPDKCCHNLKPNSRLVILVHGISRDYKEKWVQDMTEQLITLPNINVIALNWQVQFTFGLLNNTIFYKPAYNNIGKIADQTAKFVAENLIKSQIVDLEHLHILGHSMGAHIAGQIADRLKKNYGVTVNRVTGLDPALPCFKQSGSQWSLEKSHAEFVDVIHTNCGPDEDATFGLYRSHGHVDIYPNGGDDQPGCPRAKGPILPTLPAQPIFSIGSALYACGIIPDVGRNLVRNTGYLWCNHYKAPEYLTLSIKNKDCEYLAVPWESKEKLDTQTVEEVCTNGACVKMGINAVNHHKFDTRYYIDMRKVEENCLR